MEISCNRLFQSTCHHNQFDTSCDVIDIFVSPYHVRH